MAGFLSSYITNKVILGAIPLAVAEVNNNSDLLEGHRIEFVPADTGDASEGRLQVSMTSAQRCLIQKETSNLEVYCARI